MREFVVILALLARCWRVLSRIASQRCAVPADVIDEFQALDTDLRTFFNSPDTVLGLGVVMTDQPPPPVQQPVKPVICPDCGGTGKFTSRYMGVPDEKCGKCDGARMVWPPKAGVGWGDDVFVPAWGEEGADWYGKDQRQAPKGYAESWRAKVRTE